MLEELRRLALFLKPVAGKLNIKRLDRYNKKINRWQMGCSTVFHPKSSVFYIGRFQERVGDLNPRYDHD